MRVGQARRGRFGSPLAGWDGVAGRGSRAGGRRPGVAGHLVRVESDLGGLGVAPFGDVDLELDGAFGSLAKLPRALLACDARQQAPPEEKGQEREQAAARD